MRSMRRCSEISEQAYAACSGVFLVEDIEGRQADVRDFLLGEDYRRSFMSRYVACRTVEADAPLASDTTPATPNAAVTTFLRQFTLEVFLERDIACGLWIGPDLGPKQ